MFEVFFYSFLITILFTPFGVFFTDRLNISFLVYSKQQIFGLFVLSFIAVFLDFFFPLGMVLNSFLIPFYILLIIYYIKNFLNLKFITFCLLNSIIVTLLILESEVYRPDAGLYHLPYIGILNSEKIIAGITNLHSRYGHISIIQYLSAYSQNILFGVNGLVFPGALIASSVIINFVYQIYKYNIKQHFNFHFFFLLFVSIYIFYKMNRYSEYGNDAPAHFLVFFLISELILYKNKSSISDIANNLALCLFIVLNKVMLVVIGLTSLLIISKKQILSLLKNIKFVFVILFFIVYILKNIISTGCILYPLKFTCYNNLSWVTISEIREISAAGEAWSKGISDLSASDKNKYLKYEDFNKNFNWVKAWSEKHLIIIFEILIPYLIFCFTVIFFILKKDQLKKNKLDKYYINLFIVILICNIIWFLKAPLYRYGYSLIISFLSISFALIILKFHLHKKNYF